MSDRKSNSGACLCGKVTFIAKNASQHVGSCHCHTCRKWGGSAFMEIDCGNEVEFTGEQNISLFQSSDWAERGFCKHCGTHLFYRLKSEQLHMMPVGLFEDDSNFKFTQQVFIDQKPDYYEFANKTECLTGKELFAMYAPPE
jgi:hypothetical protein